MKKIILLLAIAIGIVFIACDKEEDKEIGTPQNKVDGINGSWLISSVIQIDERNLPPRSRDISQFYISTENKISINFNGSDRTFNIEEGDGISYLGSGSGSWYFDNDDFPTYLFLDYGVNNVVKLALGAPTRSSDNELKILFTSSCDTDTSSIARVSYKYVFVRN